MASNDPKPITALKFSNENNAILNLTEINKMLNHSKVKDRKIVVFSIVGGFRKGKSFFLDYCLRYLYANYSSVQKPNRTRSNPNWMGEPDEPLKGFSWRSGTDRDTTGIVIWSDIFLHTMDNGDEIALLVIDTQGLFDDKSGTAENFKIFALSSLLSSIQVLNVMQQLDENQLQHLNFATNFANFVGNEQGSETKPFQKLAFLIRDFQNPDDYPFGMNGGAKYINEILDSNKVDQNEEVKSVRQQIKNTYQVIECCLLPHPGDTVRESKKYDGRLSGMSDRSKEAFKKAIEHFLNPKNLITKKINDMDITGSEMKNHINTYFELIQTNNIQIKSFAEGMIDTYMNGLIVKCLDKYELSKLKYEDIKEDDNIDEMHKIYKNKALDYYNNSKKMGNDSHVDKFKILLKEKIHKKYLQWKLQMKSIAKEKENTFKADEARKESEKAQKALENQVQQMTAMMALSTASNILGAFVPEIASGKTTPIFIPSDSMMPNMSDMADVAFNIFDRFKKKKENEENKSSKKVFEKVLNLSSTETDDSDDE